MAPSITDAEIAEFLALGTDQTKMVRRFEQMNPMAIAVVMAHLRSTGATGATFEAIRDAGRAIVDQKLTARLITTLEKLDKSATVLAVVGIGLGVIIGVAGIIVPVLVK